MDIALDFHNEVLLSLEDFIKADPHCVQSNNGLICVPLHWVLDILILHSFSSSTSVEKFTNLFLESEGRDDASPCPLADKAHSPLESHFKDVCQKISEPNEIQGQPAGDKSQHVIAAQVASMQHMMESVGKTLRDHEGQLSALDDTQRRVAEEFSNLEMRLTSLQKNHICKVHDRVWTHSNYSHRFQDVSLKDIQASLANLEANLSSYRHDLGRQLRDKSNGLCQCISDSLTGIQSSQLSLDERLAILEKKANGIRTAQDKNTGLLSQALAGIHSLSQGFMMLLDHTQDIGVIRTALCDMQEAMESVRKSLEQISGDGSADMSQSCAHAQLSLTEELLCSTHGFPITSSRVLDGDMAGLEDLLQPTTGVDGAVSSSNDQRISAAKLYHYSVTAIYSVIPVVSIQSGILWAISQCRILHNKLSGAWSHAFFLASVAVFLVFIGFFSALRGGLPKTQEVVDRPLCPEPCWQWHFLSYIPDAA
ncbi:hypothetical protein EDC04DRAFT_2601929 [Pisolithus marmoratus]|nr:hypothetical protein EDC04DRAFT_2601929 [Pisolithus marmoratus]